MTPSLSLTLPWPDKGLSPNARVNYYIRARLAKQARTVAYLLTKAQAPAPPWPKAPKELRARAIFHAPDKRARDLFDNLPASIKPMMDGIFDALGLDDWIISEVVLERGSIVKGGEVQVILEVIRRTGNGGVKA